jgi:hypothetical protein
MRGDGLFRYRATRAKTYKGRLTSTIADAVGCGDGCASVVAQYLHPLPWLGQVRAWLGKHGRLRGACADHRIRCKFIYEGNRGLIRSYADHTNDVCYLLAMLGRVRHGFPKYWANDRIGALDEMRRVLSDEIRAEKIRAFLLAPVVLPHE